ncbi:hypothetical protein ID866_7024, partial [Astraeus odoratus]
FLVFFSSRLDGKLWCPDCVAVERLINQTFTAKESPPALLVYVGQRDEWRSKDNIFRGAPWHLTAIPTIIKLNEAGDEIDRLVENDVQDPGKFALFVRES